MIEPRDQAISLRRQCALIGLPRATYYYQPSSESAFNLQLMRLIDEQYLKTPFYGWPRMTAHLRRQGYPVNHKRVQRLMQIMGLQAIYPKPKTTQAGQDIKFIPICSATWRLLDQTRFGVPTLRMFRSTMASCIWWRSWTGSAAMCWHGNSPIRLTASSASMRYDNHCVEVSPTSSTPIKAYSSPLWSSPPASKLWVYM
jgi:hypothetical protein